MTRGLVLGAAFCALTLSVFAEGLPPSIVDLPLPTEAGSALRLSTLEGQVVLLDFWASWCVPCRASFPALDALQKEFGLRGLRIVAINVDENPKDAEAFLAARPHGFTIVLDPNGVTAAAFRLKGMPSSVLVDRSGQIRYSHVGYTEKTLRQYRAELLTLLGES